MRNTRRYLLILTTCFVLSAFADSNSSDQPRVALLIANVAYRTGKFRPLPPHILVSTVHLYDVLKAEGFTIYNDAPLVNLAHDEMETAFGDFAKQVPEHALVVIYYVGHGTERDTLNYLVPVGSDDGLNSNNLLERLLAYLKQQDVTSIVIIDACRESSGSMAKPSNLRSNTLVGFPTLPGHFATASTIYTDAIARHLQETITIDEVFRKVRNDVWTITGDQEPQVYGSLGRTVYIARPRHDFAEGSLITSDQRTYYVFSRGRKRRIPDVPSFEPLGFNPAFALNKSDEDLSQIPDGEPFPSINSNLLTSKTCTYYLFWGMKWCLPPISDVDQSVPFTLRKNGRVRSLLAAESEAIPKGDPRSLPGGINVRFADSPDVYQSDAGTLRAVGSQEVATLNPPVILALPKIMRELLSTQKGGSNQISGSLLIADPARHQFFVGRQSSVVAYDLAGKNYLGAIDLKPGVPELMVLAETRGWLFVADSAQHMIHIIDAKSHQRLEDIPQNTQVPTLITGLALSPDERRLYVGNQGGESVASIGSISVFDLTHNHQLVSTIGNVNCPEGMAMSPDGDRIYLASQCGRNDPVFIIDTSTEDVTAIPGFPVGHSVAIAPPWQKAYVSRVDYLSRDATGKDVRVPAQVSAIDIFRKQLVTSWPSDLHSFAVTPDGNYVLGIGGSHMEVIDARTDRVIYRTEFESRPTGVAVAPSIDGKDAMCYVWLPESPRLFFSGLSDLVKSSSP